VALLTERLQAARKGLFVGRAAERALFEAALTAAEPPFCVLHVFGLGGVGKTTLLREFATVCERTTSIR
jgi:ABC-type transport system involved in cytochrome c biogenesis ATPase subunit